MSTIEITRMEDVQVGDLVTLEDRRDPSDDGTFEPDPEWRLTGHVRAIDVTHTTRDGEPYGWSVRIGHTPYMVGYLSPGGVMWAYSLVSATREMPEWKPGTAGTATVRGIKGVRVMRTSGTGGADRIWLSASMVSGVRGHAEGDVTDFVPDDAEALRRSLEVAREGYRKEAADWRARDTRMGAEVDRLDAEVERWKAEAEMLTAKVDRLMPLQEHENECAYRQRTEKAESEVERLRAARQVPTRKQIVGAMWPDAPESARAGMTNLDIVDRILALIEQGDES